jgi:CubicO group peptidase (beta-lactamase class C family)
LRRILIPVLVGLSLLAAGPASAVPAAQFTPPADWAQAEAKGLSRFTAPERDLALVIVDVGEASDASAAVAAAWARQKPGFTAKPQLVTPAAPGDGWDERVSFSWETPPAERSVRAAVAQRAGKAWTVTLIDGAIATYAKRSAAVGLLQQSVRPAGYTRETFAGREARRLTPERIALMRQFVGDAATQLGVPGVGLAFVDQGKVVWQGGVGVRELGKPDPVDANTKFMIASNTKGMATLLLSVLADDGKLQWDQTVVDLYPTFRLGDEATTQSTLVRHLVCACTGLPRKDFSLILADRGAPASDTFVQLAQTQPTSRFGELFQYNNLMASAAGYVGGALSHPGMELGTAFDRAMDERIFRPLGMRDTGFDFARGMAGNWAPPHGVDLDGRVVPMSNSFNETVFPHRPAGGAFSTAADMARYVQLELGKDLMPDGKRLVSEANITERRKHGVPVGEDAWYGMGLFERTAWGVPVVTHGGTLQGYHSNFYVLPEAGIGAVILTNADPGSALLAPFLRRLLELVYDGKPQAAAEVTAAAARLKAQAAARTARLAVPGDPAVLAALASHYRSAEGFQVHLTREGGQTMLRAGFIESPVATRANSDGTVSLVSSGPGIINFDALIGADKGVRTLTVKDSQHEYVYRAVD